jgi:hypothetical protein
VRVAALPESAFAADAANNSIGEEVRVTDMAKA